MKEAEEHNSLRVISFGEKIIRLFILAILFIICFVVVDVLSYNFVMYIVGCAYIYIFYCIMKGERIFPAFFYNRNKNRN